MESYQVIPKTTFASNSELEYQAKKRELEKQKKEILDRLHAQEIPLKKETYIFINNEL